MCSSFHFYSSQERSAARADQEDLSEEDDAQAQRDKEFLAELRENKEGNTNGGWNHFVYLTLLYLKVARNEVENASFAQRSAHRDSRIWRPELIEPAAERKRRARGRRPTFKSAYPDPQILPQCNISSNYPL